MFKTSKFSKLRTKLIALTIMSCFGTQVYAERTAEENEEYARLKDRAQMRISRSTSIVFGKTREGKSTLINLLMYVSEYASLKKDGDILVDSADPIKPIVHADVLNNRDLKVAPRFFNADISSMAFNSIQGISLFSPVIGPIPVLDFKERLAENSFDLERPAAVEGCSDGQTLYATAYPSQARVKNPAFQTTLIDAPGLSEEDRLALLRNSLEAIPQSLNQLNAFMLVIGADTLANGKFNSEIFKYYTEIRDLLREVDPSLDRVFLVVTKSADEKFLELLDKKDPHRVVSERFKAATSVMDGKVVKEEGITVPAERIFFFENQYNCLSKDSIEDLYRDDLNTESDQVLLAKKDRVNNFKLNLFESFRLLRAISAKAPVSRNEIFKKIEGESFQYAQKQLKQLRGDVDQCKASLESTQKQLKQLGGEVGKVDKKVGQVNNEVGDLKPALAALQLAGKNLVFFSKTPEHDWIFDPNWDGDSNVNQKTMLVHCHLWANTAQSSTHLKLITVYGKSGLKITDIHTSVPADSPRLVISRPAPTTLRFSSNGWGVLKSCTKIWDL